MPDTTLSHTTLPHNSFEITILGCGTSTGVPLIGCNCAVCTSSDPKNVRTRPSVILRFGSGVHLLIDTSMDFRQQALRDKISRLDAILYTHSHSDHILGLEDIRGYNYLQKGPIPCYGTANTLRELKRFFHYIFQPDPHYVGGAVPQITPHQIEDGVPFSILNIPITPFALIHGNVPVTGFRFGDFAYATDCKIIPQESRAILEGVNTLILDGLRMEAHGSHLTISEAIDISRELQIPRTILTHMTHSIDYTSVSASLPPGVELGYDGMTVIGHFLR